MKDFSSAAVLISTYRRPEGLRQMLESLFRQTYPASSLHVLVFNDAGSDESSALMESLFAARRSEGWRSLRCIDNPGPRVHIASARARLANEAPADAHVLVFADDDAELEPGCLATLVNALMEDPSIGAVGPRIRQRGFPGRAVHTAGFMDPWTGRYRHRDCPGPLDCDWLNSTCLAVRRDVYDRTEGFWPGFHVAHAEVDLCLQIKEAGCRVVYRPDASADHDIEPGTPKRDRLYYIYRNKILLIRRRLRGLRKVSALCVTAFLGLPRYLLESLFFHRRVERREWRTIVQAVWDGLRGRSGPRPLNEGRETGR